MTQRIVHVSVCVGVCLITGDVRFVHLASFCFFVFFFAPFGDRLGLNNIISSQLWLTSPGATKPGRGLALQTRMKKVQVVSLCLLVYHFLSKPNRGLKGPFLQHFLTQSVHPSNTEPILFTSCHLLVCSGFLSRWMLWTRLELFATLLLKEA